MFVLLWITQEQHFWFHSQTKHYGCVEAIKHQHTYRLCGHPHTRHTDGRLSWNKLVRHVTNTSPTLLTLNKTCLWCSLCANESQRTETGPIVDGWIYQHCEELEHDPSTHSPSPGSRPVGTPPCQHRSGPELPPDTMQERWTTCDLESSLKPQGLHSKPERVHRL